MGNQALKVESKCMSHHSIVYQCTVKNSNTLTFRRQKYPIIFGQTKKVSDHSGSNVYSFYKVPKKPRVVVLGLGELRACEGM